MPEPRSAAERYVDRQLEAQAKEPKPDVVREVTIEVRIRTSGNDQQLERLLDRVDREMELSFGNQASARLLGVRTVEQ